MANQYQTLEVNAFVKGFITEASPLTFPENASVLEKNFVLNRDGTRNRRLGMQEEEGNAGVDIHSIFAFKKPFVSAFEWDSPGGAANHSFLVFQDGLSVRIFDRTSSVIGDAELFSFIPSGSEASKTYAVASVDGYLVVATGAETLSLVTYEDGLFNVSDFRLKIRDVFGVEDGLYGGMDITTRPASLTGRHEYNLRNQTWGVPRFDDKDPVHRDPISKFYKTHDSSLYPSHADTVNQALWADPNNGKDRMTKRFFPEEVINNPLGTVEAPRGYFIIDALSRGESRKQEYENLLASNSILEYGENIQELPEDKTISGCSALAEYAGRMWYGGFGSQVVGSDAKSPRLGSYVLFSNLVDDSSDFPQCYQEGDPTSPEDYELVDTDGGFIRIDDVVNIRKLVAVDRVLVVLAENGVWTIEGGSDYGFTATNYMVRKITDRGIVSPASAVLVDKSLFFWSDSALMMLAPDEFSSYTPHDLTNTTIQSFYDTIPYEDKDAASGAYDSYEQNVRWVYSGNMELIFDLNLQAFYINQFADGKEVRSVFNVTPYRGEFVEDTVTVGGVPVTVGGVNAVIKTPVRRSSRKEVKYAVITDGDKPRLTFASLSNREFKDWGTEDAEALLLTGYTSGGDYQRNKQVPYLTLHFMRTEDGVNSDYSLSGESSCLVRSMWEWSNRETSNRWGRQFQGYRYKRAYIPTDEDDSFDTGFQVITTKSKLRGKGKVLSLMFKTEPGKDCHLLGWSMVMGVNSNV